MVCQGLKRKERGKLGQKGREEFQVKGLQGLGPAKATTGFSGMVHLLQMRVLLTHLLPRGGFQIPLSESEAKLSLSH